MNVVVLFPKEVANINIKVIQEQKFTKVVVVEVFYFIEQNEVWILTYVET